MSKQWRLLGLIRIWALVYLNLKTASDFVVFSLLRMPPGLHLTETVRFFLFEVPKVLLLLTFPETIILKKVLKLPLIFIFVGIVAVGIMIVGFLFNLVFYDDEKKNPFSMHG